MKVDIYDERCGRSLWIIGWRQRGGGARRWRFRAIEYKFCRRERID